MQASIHAERMGGPDGPKVLRVHTSFEEGDNIALRVTRVTSEECDCGQVHDDYYKVIVSEVSDRVVDEIDAMIAHGELPAHHREDMIHDVLDGVSMVLDVEQLAQIAAPLMHALSKFDPDRLAVELDRLSSAEV